EAAPAAAATLTRIGHLNFHVAQLGPVAMLALQHHVADHDAAADTCAEREKDHAMDVAAGAHPELTVRGGIAIVLKCRWHIERVLHMLPHRDVPPRLEIRRIENDAGRNVHRTWGGDADGSDLLFPYARVCDGMTNRLAHPLEAKLLTFLRFGRQAHGA